MNKFIQRESKNILSLLRENKRTILTLLVLFTVIESLLKKSSSDLIAFGVLILYVVFIKMFTLRSTFTFLLCLILLIVMSADYLLTSSSISTEKAAVWFVLFLIAGIIQGWRE